MKVAIRTDGSAAIGAGHVMRCLALADELRARGAVTSICTRAMAPALAERIARSGHELLELDLPPELPRAAVESEADHERQLEDAAATRACLPAALDVLLVDHYGLGHTWETAVRSHARLLAAVDDLGRAHDCDVLVDQNFYADAAGRYAGRVPPGCTALLGPAYALLRGEFREARTRVSVRDGDVRRIVVQLGGVDAANLTARVLNALRLLQVRARVDVVIGAAHPDRTGVEAACAALPEAVLHVQSSEVAALLAEADLAIGAGGTGTWERCALGVPALALCVADNQRRVLAEAGRRGLVYALEGRPPDDAGLAVHVRALLENAALRAHLSRTSLDLVDARGCSRVAAALCSRSISVREANDADAPVLLRWRNDPAVRAVSRSAAEVSAQDHQRWWAATRANPNRHLLVGERDGQAIGSVRFDVAGDKAEVSIYLDPARIGTGDGGGLLASGEAWLAGRRQEVRSIDAVVRDDNASSRRLFERGGYRAEWIRYTKRI
jgi:UDP-2,4-diacetamido-2,4,6-trideoxy-beta-L-altropyranose hydrolase